MNKKIRILIDPGHGGPKDRYNRGPGGYIEADGVLQISKYLRNELASTDAFEIKMSRETDIGVTVRGRGKMAWEFKADVAISQHTNAANGTARGSTVFYSVDLPDDRQFATDLAKAIADAIGTNDRGAKTWESTVYIEEDYLGFIDEAQDGGCKHVFLVESAFHDNLEDEAILLKDENLKKIAVAQAGVICKFFGVTYPAKKEPIMGESQATVDQLYEYAYERNPSPKISVPLVNLCRMFIEEGKAEGVRGDIAFCQACKETGFFGFKGLAKPEWNNYCGLGVTGAIGEDGEPIGNKFPDARTGVRAQIQHLKGYASKESLTNELVDIRYKYISLGIAPNWEDLNNRWAVPGNNYGQSILEMFKELMVYPADSLPRIEVANITKHMMLGEAIIIKAKGYNCTEIKLYDNDIELISQKGDIFFYAYKPEFPGEHVIGLEAIGNGTKAVHGTIVNIEEEIEAPVETPIEEPIIENKKAISILEFLFELIKKLLGKK